MGPYKFTNVGLVPGGWHVSQHCAKSALPLKANVATVARIEKKLSSHDLKHEVDIAASGVAVRTDFLVRFLR